MRTMVYPVMEQHNCEEKVRLDKWLWAARFFKTRSSAAQAVTGGHVHLNGVRQKPSRLISCGDELRIRRGEYEFIVIVVGISGKRGPAKIARLLYEESQESIAARERLKEQKKLLHQDMLAPRQKPSKRDRRLIRTFTRKEG